MVHRKEASSVGHGHWVRFDTQARVVGHRSGWFGLHGQASGPTAQSPFQHSAGVTLGQVRVHSASLVTQMRSPVGRVHEIGDETGHGQSSFVAAHSLFQHTTGVSAAHDVEQLPSKSAQRPLGHLNGEKRGHGHKSNDETHDVSQHCTCPEGQRTHWSLFSAQRPVGQTKERLDGHGSTHDVPKTRHRSSGQVAGS